MRGPLLLSALLSLLAGPISGADVLTQRYNNARTGASLDETLLTTSNVNSARFGKKWNLYADGQVVAQPLYVSGLAIDTAANANVPPVKGVFNAVILATLHNTIYVYDADTHKLGPDGRSVTLWAKWLGKPRPGGKDIDMWSTNDPEWGILSTPVISNDKQSLYVVSWHDEGAGGFQYRLHQLRLKDGTDVRPAVPIGPASTAASQPCKKQSEFNPCLHKQRTALLLNDGLLYIAFGGDGNRGAMFVFDAQTLTQRAFWSATPTGGDGGIWQSGQGPAADAQGNVYLMTGNGSFGGQNFGNSFLKLKVEGQNVVVKDSFTPCNFKFLNDVDLDLGSGGPVLLPVTPPRIVGGGKEGVLYVLSQTNMGKHVASPNAPDCQNPNAIQHFLAFDVHLHGGKAHYGNIHGSPIYWRGPGGVERMYVWGENSTLKAYTFKQGKFQDIANPKKSAYRPPDGMPGGMIALSANGTKAGTGILWAVVPLDGDANEFRGVKGIVLALDAQDVSRTLWTSEQFAQRDRLGLFAKFAPPLVAAGKVFVATYGDDEAKVKYDGGNRPGQFPKNYYVAVYGALGPDAPAPQVVNQSRDDIAMVRAELQPLTLNRSLCTAIDASSSDCTEALRQAAGGAPSFHQVVIANSNNLAGCMLVRVTTASKNAGFNNSVGIGFWSTTAAGGNLAPEDSGLFRPKAQLKQIGTATLLNGAPATLHEFSGIANCTASGGETLSRLFKPFMQFEGGAEGKIFRNWDLADNYSIGAGVTQIDRRPNILQP
ncbi:MAG TPA: hypothetical protein VER03_21760 [Bryobacteraceae bacterium]|nr:hypothetical protein [Bryobacteraceae bacterium]